MSSGFRLRSLLIFTGYEVGVARERNILKSLTEREVENLSARIQKLDLKGAVCNWEALLPNELIHAVREFRCCRPPPSQLRCCRRARRRRV